MVDRVTWYLLMMEGDRYRMELVKVHTSCPGHHGYQTEGLVLSIAVEIPGHILFLFLRVVYTQLPSDPSKMT